MCSIFLSLTMNIFKKLTRICVASHDAGGAEVVSSYVKRNRLDCMYHLAGPAVDIFTKKLGPVISTSLEECLVECDLLLCSMGWSDHEWHALAKAKEMDKRVIVFLDHWTGYKTRFIRNEIMILPDEIWVGDTSAEIIAKEVFPNLSIKLVPNPYYADLKDEIDLLPSNDDSENTGKKILYVCEPTASKSDVSKSSGYTDHDALRYFLKCISERKELIGSICLRPHPSEPQDKYAWALKNEFMSIAIGGKNSLLEEISASDWVVGRSSMALVVGLIANKTVFSCIPIGGVPCTLPFKEILKLG